MATQILVRANSGNFNGSNGRYNTGPGGPQCAFKDDLNGWMFVAADRNGGSDDDLTWFTTTDGGLSWEFQGVVPHGISSPAILAVRIHPDWHTEGDTGDVIHIAFADNQSSAIRYITYDTSDGTWAGTTETVFSFSGGVSYSISQSTRPCITKSTDGEIVVQCGADFGGDGIRWYRRNGGTWTLMSQASVDIGSIANDGRDQGYCVALGNDKVMLIVDDYSDGASTDSYYYRIYDTNSDTWDISWTVIAESGGTPRMERSAASFFESLNPFTALYDRTTRLGPDGGVYVIYSRAPDRDTNGEIRCWTYDIDADEWTERGLIYGDTGETEHTGACVSSINIDTGHVVCAYQRKENGSHYIREAWSTDLGVTWFGHQVAQRDPPFVNARNLNGTHYHYSNQRSTAFGGQSDLVSFMYNSGICVDTDTVIVDDINTATGKTAFPGGAGFSYQANYGSHPGSIDISSASLTTGYRSGTHKLIAGFTLGISGTYDISTNMFLFHYFIGINFQNEAVDATERLFCKVFEGARAAMFYTAGPAQVGPGDNIFTVAKTDNDADEITQSIRVTVSTGTVTVDHIFEDDTSLVQGRVAEVNLVSGSTYDLILDGIRPRRSPRDGLTPAWTNNGAWSTYNSSARVTTQATGTMTGTPADAEPDYTAIDEIGFGRLTNTSLSAFRTLIDYILFGSKTGVFGGNLASPTVPKALARYSDLVVDRWSIFKSEGNQFQSRLSLEIGAEVATKSVYFKVEDESIAFTPDDAGAKVGNDFYALRFLGHASSDTGVQFGKLSSGVLSGGSSVLADVNNKFDLEMRGTIDDLKLYSSNFVNMNKVDLGDTSTALVGAGVDIQDTKFSKCGLVTKNITGSPTLSGVSIQEPTTVAPAASLLLHDKADVSGDDVAVVGGSGITTPDDSVTTTVKLTNVNFTTFASQWLRIHNDYTIQVVNPKGWTPTLTDQVQLNFDGGDDNNSVELLWPLSITCQQPDGTLIEDARTFVYEGTLNNDLPVANRQSTDVNGEASSEVLANIYTSNVAGTAVDQDPRGDFALKVYQYGKVPFVTSLTFVEALSLVVPLGVDTAIGAATAALALTAGSGITITRPTNPVTLIDFEGGAGYGNGGLSVNDVVTGDSSGATGTVEEIFSGTANAGKVVLRARNGTAFTAGEKLTVGGQDRVDISNPSNAEDFSVHIDADGKDMDVLYDFISAKTDEASIDATGILIIEWGEDEHAFPVKSGANYFTERNVNQSEGVIVTNRGSGAIGYFTSDDGTQVAPPTTVTLTVTCLDKDTGLGAEDVRVSIHVLSTGEELMNELTNSSGVASESFTYTTDTVVEIDARKSDSPPQYLYEERSGTITSSGLTLQIDMTLDTVIT